MEKKLLKIWSASTKKAVVCTNLKEMYSKGSSKLNITNVVNLKAFLEDGTELDDEETFEALPAGTVVYLLNEDEKKPWDVSMNDSFTSETIVLETPPSEPGSSYESVQYSDKVIAPSPEKGLRLFAPWPANFTIPIFLFTESLKKEATSGNLSWSSKSELLKIIAEEIFKYTSNPSPTQRDIVAKQLITEFPCLKSNIGEGHEGWSQKIYDKVKHESRKRSFFSYKRKIFHEDLEYSPKVKKTLSCEPIEDTVAANLEAKEKMLIEMGKMPGSRCSKIIHEGLKVTYEERRSAINSNLLMVDLKKRFPALFTVSGINYDFKVLYNMDLEKSMFTSMHTCTSAIEDYARKKKKGQSLLNMSITENSNKKIIRAILLVPEILGDKSEFLFQQFPFETNLQDFSNTPLTPHLCIVGDPFSSSEVYIVAEKKNLIECRDFIEGIFTLMGLYFVVNIEYPKEAMTTFKFFQSYILKLPCNNLPGKLITFCKAL